MSTPKVVFQINYLPHQDDIQDRDINFDEYTRQRKFYSSRQENDFIKYIVNGSKDPHDFVEYSGNEEKSEGIFNQDGLLDYHSRQSLRGRLRQTKSLIWKGFISFESEFGKDKCHSYEQALDLMKHEFPRFLNKAGLDAKNITWFAALHTNTDNNHIHFAFFENEPTRHRQTTKGLIAEGKHFSHGRLNQHALVNFRIRAEQRLESWNTLLAGVRKPMMDDFKQSLKKSKRGEIADMMNNLLYELPKTGRLQYDSENLAAARPFIDRITKCVISNDARLYEQVENFFILVRNKDDTTRRICKDTKTDPTRHLLFEKYKRDMYRRFGNTVLDCVNAIRFEQRQKEYEKAKGKSLKRVKRAKRTAKFEELVKLNSDIAREAADFFKEYLYKLGEFDLGRMVSGELE